MFGPSDWIRTSGLLNPIHTIRIAVQSIEQFCKQYVSNRRLLRKRNLCGVVAVILVSQLVPRAVHGGLQGGDGLAEPGGHGGT